MVLPLLLREDRSCKQAGEAGWAVEDLNLRRLSRQIYSRLKAIRASDRDCRVLGRDLAFRFFGLGPRIRRRPLFSATAFAIRLQSSEKTDLRAARRTHYEPAIRNRRWASASKNRGSVT